MSQDSKIEKVADQQNTKLVVIRRRHYITAPMKDRDWYEKAKCKIAINPSATAPSKERK
jgi:hypothetical protein